MQSSPTDALTNPYDAYINSARTGAQNPYLTLAAYEVYTAAPSKGYADQGKSNLPCSSQVSTCASLDSEPLLSSSQLSVASDRSIDSCSCCGEDDVYPAQITYPPRRTVLVDVVCTDDVFTPRAELSSKDMSLPKVEDFSVHALLRTKKPQMLRCNCLSCTLGVTSHETWAS